MKQPGACVVKAHSKPVIPLLKTLQWLPISPRLKVVNSLSELQRLLMAHLACHQPSQHMPPSHLPHWPSAPGTPALLPLRPSHRLLPSPGCYAPALYTDWLGFSPTRTTPLSSFIVFTAPCSEMVLCLFAVHPDLPPKECPLMRRCVIHSLSNPGT